MDGDAGVGLPGQEAEGVDLAAFDVEGGGVGGEVLLFVGEDGLGGVAAGGVVVVVGGELLEVWLEGWLADPPVEVEEVGVVLVDELCGEGEPVVRGRACRVGARVRGARGWARRRLLSPC